MIQIPVYRKPVLKNILVFLSGMAIVNSPSNFYKEEYFEGI
jgi:hypothetical protein